jgi:hypothetical protein
MDMNVDLPLIVTLIVTLELEQVLQAVVTHLAIQYCLDFVLLLTIGWGKCRSSANDGIRERGGQLDCGEDGVKAVEVVREFKAVCTLADAGFDDKGA